MKTISKTKFEGVAYIYILAILLLAIATSCTSSNSFDDEPLTRTGYSKVQSLDTYANDSTATILVLHKDEEYGRNKKYLDRIGVSWKAFPNSEENVDLYLKGDGYMPVWKGENTTNYTMDYNYLTNEAFIQPWPYIGLDGTVINPEGKTNVYTINFQGEQYYMFNPIEINLPSEKPVLVNFRNGNPIKYITLFCDYVSYGSHRINNFEPEDENFYNYSNLLLPESGIERNKIYVYILEDDYNFFENGRRAGNYSYEAVSVYTASHPNGRDKYEIIEYSPTTQGYYKIR